MSSIEADLKLAHALIEDREKIDKYFWQFYRMWPFTTINMQEYLSYFNLEGKTCATIVGSADHIFELFLKHPKKIFGIDTNPLTEHYFYLKYAAFNVLPNPKEFLTFFRWLDYPNFCDYNPRAFDKDIFQEISKYLTNYSFIFWEDLFKNYEPSIIRTKLFNAYDEENNSGIEGSLSYITEENYEYIKENLDKLDFTFMNTDIRNLSDELSEKIDFLTLSNLIIYAHDMYPDCPVHSFKALIDSLAKNLNDNGTIVAGYLYDIENENDDRDIYKAAIRDSIFLGDNYSYKYVTRIKDLHRERSSNNHDAILVYSKK